MPDQRRSAHVADAAASRDEVLRKAIGVGGAVLGGGALLAGLPRLASSAPSPAQDVRVLNFILVIEEMQAAFYAEALRRGRLRGEVGDGRLGAFRKPARDSRHGVAVPFGQFDGVCRRRRRVPSHRGRP